MKFELLVATRYLKAKRKQAVISLITVISIIGVGAGVAALIIALAINAGFKADLTKQYLATHKVYSQQFAKERKVYDDNNENTLQKEIVDFLDCVWKDMHKRIEAGGLEHKLVSKDAHEYELVPKK